ncbi:hypothetical protein C7974DRAFT_167704 [Boeremia exigua]|uniref:uncharacterized protein n=1 Tax=Boeremia exigua TaxID=749465 RepID=UPI001E8D9B87|nr:uncharacterized protein C7974DRAFT_167704 [Boeremia exigua]KAH6633213.1 hypothetical protein C7974DRAFT_167704 [Boeremia exigua]
MSYIPIDHGRKSPHVESIELRTRDNVETISNYAPPQMLPFDGDTKHVHVGTYYSSTKATDNWPTRSQQVAALTPLRGTILAFDIVLASSPLIFIILALKVAKLDNKVSDEENDRLQEMLLYTPTIFPLLFAALMGRFFRHLGIWLAERGTTLGRLEQLVGCQSVFLAIERQICLRNFSIVGICSILIWLLSPFGGQSALRVLRQEKLYLNATQPLQYLSPLNIQISTMGGASMVNSGRSTFTPLFLAALLSSGDFQTISTDLWGNVKLPSYRAIENSTTNEWNIIPDHNQTNVRWSSLIGIPVSAFNGEPFTSYSINQFKIRARQFDISCSNNSRVAVDWTDSVNTTVLSPWRMESGTPQTNESQITACPSYPCPFLSQSLADDASSVASCEYYYDYIEASVECIASACRATALRKLDMYTDGYTEEWEPYLLGVVMTNLMSTITSVDTIGVSSATSRGATVMEKWIFDPSNFIGTHMYDNVKLYEIPADVFAERLTILWNSFFQSTYAARALAGNLDKAVSTNITGEDVSPIQFNTTESITGQRRDVYRVRWKWLGVLLSCSLVLLVAAYAGLILKYLSTAPDIIGYASSLTMMNPYVPTPTGGTTLHGLERAALLHDLQVRLGDVCPNEPVGAIALAANDGRVIGLDRRKYYI